MCLGSGYKEVGSGYSRMGSSYKTQKWDEVEGVVKCVVGIAK